jgi:hypothetical protein
MDRRRPCQASHGFLFQMVFRAFHLTFMSYQFCWDVWFTGIADPRAQFMLICSCGNLTNL